MVNDDYYKVLEFIIIATDKFLEKYKDSKDIEILQKVNAISSYVEAIKAGADIKFLPIQDDKIPIILKLKEDMKE